MSCILGAHRVSAWQILFLEVRVRLFRGVFLSVASLFFAATVYADSHENEESCLLLDADSDGVITNTEFINKKVVLFRSLDPNDDGFIERQDVQLSEEGFEELDRDKDGKVSAYEFVDSKIVSFASMHFRKLDALDKAESRYRNEQGN